MLIPRFLISAVTFPGVIVHEVAHRFFCDIAKVPVRKVVYYQLWAPFGYVLHDEVPELERSLLITVGPFIVCTLLCAALTFPFGVLIHLKLYSSLWTWQSLLQTWLGVSIGMHAFPSQDELDAFKRCIDTSRGPLWIVSAGLRLFFVLARLGRFFWFDAIYAWLISLIASFVICSP